MQISLKPKPAPDVAVVKKQKRSNVKAQIRERVISPESVANQMLGTEKIAGVKGSSSADSIYESGSESRV